MLRAQAFDYPVEILGLGVPQNLLTDGDADVVLRCERNEFGDALETEPQGNESLSIDEKLNAIGHPELAFTIK